jgi:glutamate--cysteine ligase
MGRLGYQSDAQSALAVSYNSLQGYAESLQGALTQPYPAYEAIGVQGPDGAYRQLGTTLLQIENEFYGTIRPKRVIFPGERPLHALRERGVEYVEVRLLDLDPFEVVGINAQTLRFIDVFLLHCLTAHSAPDTPQEIAEMSRNQHRTAERGREPGLQLERVGQQVGLDVWATEILQALQPIAAHLDATHGSTDYSRAVAAAVHALQHPDTLPSARVLKATIEEHGGSFVSLVKARSQATRQAMLDAPLSANERSALEAESKASLQAQADIEAADSMPFDIYLKEYLAPHRLLVRKQSSEQGRQ